MREAKQAGEKISIIMPSYNQGKFIGEAISSVLHQSHSEIELIVIDGGSTDNTVSVLRSFGPGIAYWVSEKDKGQSDALNKAMERVTGTIVGWMNADDFYLPQAFQAVISAAEKSPKKLFFYGNNLVVDTDGKEVGRQIAFPYSVNHLIYEGFHMFTQAFFWRTHAVNGQYVFPLHLHRTMDFHFFLWLGMTYGSKSFVYLDRDLGAFRRHPEQKTTDVGAFAVDDEYAKIDQEFGVCTSRLTRHRLRRMFFRCRRAYYYATHYAAQGLNSSTLRDGRGLGRGVRGETA